MLPHPPCDDDQKRDSLFLRVDQKALDAGFCSTHLVSGSSTGDGTVCRAAKV